jgi:hypothetical protein
VEGSYEHGNEPLGSIKCWEILEKLHNWQCNEKCKGNARVFSMNSRVRCRSCSAEFVRTQVLPVLPGAALGLASHATHRTVCAV